MPSLPLVPIGQERGESGHWYPQQRCWLSQINSPAALAYLPYAYLGEVAPGPAVLSPLLPLATAAAVVHGRQVVVVSVMSESELLPPPLPLPLLSLTLSELDQAVGLPHRRPPSRSSPRNSPSARSSGSTPPWAGGHVAPTPTPPCAAPWWCRCPSTRRVNPLPSPSPPPPPQPPSSPRPPVGPRE